MKNVFFAPFGSYPCNMTEADAAGLALGAGLYQKNIGSDGCVIANMRANAAFDGQLWEALSLAESGAFRTQKSAGLPILFTLIRGREAEEGETSIRRCTARICVGIGSNGMHAETVNASDPLAVIDAVSRKKEMLKRGEGAVLLEMVCDDLTENTKGVDPVKIYREKLIRQGIADESDLKKLEEYISGRLERICRLAADDEKSPPAEAFEGEDVAFACAGVPARAVRKIMPEVKIPQKNCKRWQSLQKKHGEASENTSSYQLSDALFEPILDMMYRDPDFSVFAMNDKEAVLQGLSDVAESNRFLCVPVSKTALVSCALGYVLRGGRAVVSLDSSDAFSSVADVLIRQVAKWRLFCDELSVPLVFRVPTENQNQAKNTEILLSLAEAIPGLKAVYPVTPYEARGLMEAALREENPVVFFERSSLYDITEQFEEKGVPTDPYCLPIGKTALKKEGKDITVLTVGASLYTALRAAETLSQAHGVEAEILNAGTIVPLDYESVLCSVEKTGKLLIVGEGPERGSVMRDFAAVLGELAFDLLDAPVIAIGSGNSASGVPTETDIIRAIHQKIIPLKGI